MGRIKRYRTAWSRHHRSNGFGIHSPFAFRFVLDVLRERLPYYAYDEIARLRKAVIHATGNHWHHPRVISLKNAKMLFRITNRFNPQVILQMGTSYGVSTACVAAVSRRSRLWLYEPHLDRYPVESQVLAPLAGRVTAHNSLPATVDDYRRHIVDAERPYVLINDLPCGEDDYDSALAAARWAVDRGGVIIVRNIAVKPLVKRLWKEIKDYATVGQAFTNEKIAIFVANPKLPRQDFFLWF